MAENSVDQNDNKNFVDPAETPETANISTDFEKSWNQYEATPMQKSDEQSKDLVDVLGDEAGIADQEKEEEIQEGDEAANAFYENTPEGQQIKQKRDETRKKFNSLPEEKFYKQITSAMVGKVDADTPVGKFIKGYTLPVRVTQIAIHDLIRSTLQTAHDVSDGIMRAEKSYDDWVNGEKKVDEEKYKNIIPRPEFDLVEKQRTPTAEFLADMSEFMVPFGAAAKWFKFGKSIISAKEAGAAGAIAFIVQDPKNENIANLANKYPWFQGWLTDALEADIDDPAIINRFKNSVLEAGLDIAAFQPLMAGGQAIYRWVRGKSSIGGQITKDILDERGIKSMDDIYDNADVSGTSAEGEGLLKGQAGKVGEDADLEKKLTLYDMAKKGAMSKLDAAKLKFNIFKSTPEQIELNTNMEILEAGGVLNKMQKETMAKSLGVKDVDVELFEQRTQEVFEFDKAKQILDDNLEKRLSSLQNDRIKTWGIKDQVEQIKAWKAANDEIDNLETLHLEQQYRLDDLLKNEIRPFATFFEQVKETGAMDANHPSLTKRISVTRPFMHLVRGQGGFINFEILRSLKEYLKGKRFLNKTETNIETQIDEWINDPIANPFPPKKTTSRFAINEDPGPNFQKGYPGPHPVVVGSKEARQTWWRNLRGAERHPSEIPMKNRYTPVEYDIDFKKVNRHINKYIETNPDLKITNSEKLISQTMKKYSDMGWKLADNPEAAERMVHDLDSYLQTYGKNEVALRQGLENAFKEGLPVSGFASDKIHIEDFKKLHQAAVEEKKPITLTQQYSKPTTSLRKGQVDGMYLTMHNALAAQQRGDLVTRGKLLKDFRMRLWNFLMGEDTLKPQASVRGHILKDTDLGDQLNQLDLEPGETLDTIDYRKFKEMVGLENQATIEAKTMAIMRAMANNKLDLQAINLAGHPEFKRRFSSAVQFLDTASNVMQKVIAMNILSGVSTTYVVAKGAVSITGLKFIEEGLSDILFNNLYRTIRANRGLPQVKNNTALDRFISYKEELGEASRNVWDYLTWEKNAVELDFSKNNKDDDWRIAMQGESPLEVFRKHSLNVITPYAVNRAKKGLVNLWDKSLKGAELIYGLRDLKAIDLFLRNLNLPATLKKHVTDYWNNENVIRASQGAPILDEDALLGNILGDYEKAIFQTRRGEANRFAKDAYEEVYRMPFMNKNVKVLGTDKVNIGDVTRGFAKQLDKVPMIGRVLGLFRHVMLNTGDFLVRRSPFAGLNPDVRASWGKGRQAQVLGEAVGGTLIGTGFLAWHLLDKNKILNITQNPQERQVFKSIYGSSAYQPTIINTKTGKKYALDMTDPIGALTTYYAKWLDAIDDVSDSKDFGKFIGDLTKHHLKTWTPLQFIEKYAIMSKFTEDMDKFGYPTSKTIKNATYAGLIKEMETFKAGYVPQENVIDVKDELDSKYRRNPSEFPLRFKKLMRKAVPIWGQKGDFGVSQTDFLGHDIYIKRPKIRNEFEIGSIKDYVEVTKKMIETSSELTKMIETSPVGHLGSIAKSDYGMFIRKRLPVRNEPIYQELWKLQDVTSDHEYADKNKLELYPYYRFQIKDVINQERFLELQEAQPDKYLKILPVDVQKLWNNIYEKSFIIPDEGARAINKLSGGELEVKIGDKKTTGKREIENFLKHYNKEAGNIEKEINQATIMNPASLPYLMEMKLWSKTFHKYGSDKKTALKNLMFNESEDFIKRTFNAQIQGKDYNVVQKQQVLLEIMSRKYKPYGYRKPGFGANIDEYRVDSLDGLYVFKKIIMPHLSPERREQAKADMRGYVNQVVRPYNDFARYIYLQQEVLQDKDFQDNLAKEAYSDLEESTEGFSQDPSGRDVYFHGVKEE